VELHIIIIIIIITTTTTTITTQFQTFPAEKKNILREGS
jgi:hypothetical protein